MSVVDKVSSSIALQRLSEKNVSLNYFDDLGNKVAVLLFTMATYLTDPICKSHELFRRIYVVDALNPTSHKIINFIRKIFLFCGIIFYSSISVFTTIPGIVLRYFGTKLQKNPFIHLKGKALEKNLSKDNTFNILSWNVCFVGGGYTISDGGVLPWVNRIDKIINKIKSVDADVNCLYEVFDIKSAFHIYEKLKDKYSHFYFNIGPLSIGVSSGILIASKYEIKNPEFIKFPKDYLVGRTKNSQKGVFSFDVVDKQKEFARIYSTHLQHSEEPQFPTQEEIVARKKQMQLITEKVRKIKNKAVVVTGDLNLDDEEYNKSLLKKYFFKRVVFRHPNYTWGGDHFCAKMVGKKVSCPLNLDHTMIVRKTAKNISTSLISTGYDSSKFTKDAISDHLADLPILIFNFPLE